MGWLKKVVLHVCDKGLISQLMVSVTKYYF